jgi:hypothetical protein
MKRFAKSAGLDTRSFYQSLSAKSVRAAVAEQGLLENYRNCQKVIPDIATQYTRGFDRAEYERYWEVKLRGLHAFQMRCMHRALELFDKNGLVLADIGDSSGNHGAYIRALSPRGKVARVISINLDPVAVEKVKAKGEEAILCRAEELGDRGVQADMYMTFEMVEHLLDPARFLHDLALKGSADYLLMTVPYLRQSRVGLHELRIPELLPEKLTAESVHIFELAPEDWILLCRFSGWKAVWTDTYFQYPKRSWLRSAAPVWRNLDYEGFWGVLLRRDLSAANRYGSWS